MTVRVGASFNTAIEAEGFLACSFCCSKDEGASCPLLRLTLAGCFLIRIQMPTGAPPPHCPMPSFLPICMSHRFVCGGAFPCSFFILKHCFQNWNFWVKFSVIGK